MSDNSWIPIAAQPEDVRGLPESERNALLISATQVNGQWVILSRYGDDIWQLDGFPSNTPPNRKRMDFGTVPSAFRAVMKAMMYRYLRRGRNGTGRPKGSMIKQSFSEALNFCATWRRSNSIA